MHVLINYNDLESIVEEMSATCDKTTILRIYIMKQLVNITVPFYVHLMNKDKRKLFMERSQRYLIPGWIIYHMNI